MKCLIEALAKCSQYHILQFRYLEYLKCFEQKDTPEMLSDWSEVFDWSALAMLLAPESPMWFPVV